MAQLKEGSVIKKSTGDEVIATMEDINNIPSPSKSDIGLGNVDNTSDLDKPISTATQTALDGKVNNSQVLTNVPSGAKFTDTVYTHPSTHPYSMITGTPTSLPANGGDADTVDGKHASEFATSAQGTLATNALPKSGGTMTGILYPQRNTSYTTGQARRIVLSTGNPSGGGNGDVWIKYT